MIRLNGIEYTYRPGMSLKELVDAHNANHPRLVFNGFAVLVNGTALTALQAEETALQENDRIFIVPLLSGG